MPVPVQSSRLVRPGDNDPDSDSAAFSRQAEEDTSANFADSKAWLIASSSILGSLSSPRSDRLYLFSISTSAATSRSAGGIDLRRSRPETRGQLGDGCSGERFRGGQGAGPED